MRAVLQVFENYQKARVNFVQTVAEQGAHTVHVSMEKYFKNENRKARASLPPPRLPTRAGVALRCRARWRGGWS